MFLRRKKQNSPGTVIVIGRKIGQHDIELRVFSFLCQAVGARRVEDMKQLFEAVESGHDLSERAMDLLNHHNRMLLGFT